MMRKKISEGKEEGNRVVYNGKGNSITSDGNHGNAIPTPSQYFRKNPSFSMTGSSSRYEDVNTTDESEDEMFYNNHRKSIIRHVPLIENIVMGREKTVVDEEHSREQTFLEETILDIDNDYDDWDSGKKWYFVRLRKITLAAMLLALGKIFFLFDRWIPKSKRLRRRYLSCTFIFALMVMFIQLLPNWTSKNELVSTDQNNLASINRYYDSDTEGAHNYDSNLSDNSGSAMFHQQNSAEGTIIENETNFIPQPPSNIELDKIINVNLADVVSDRKLSELPLYWHIPRSAGFSMKDLLDTCYGLVIASESFHNGSENIDALEVVMNEAGARYVNVDTMTRPGIDQAASLGLVYSGLPDVVVTSSVSEAGAMLFTPRHRGRLFTIVRNPIDRIASHFHYLTQSDSDLTSMDFDKQDLHTEMASMSLEEYAKTPRGEFNWMVRSLTGKWNVDLTQNDLEMAKTLLQLKCLIGLFDDKAETIRRFTSYFKLNHSGHQNKRKHQKCIKNLLREREELTPIEEGSEIWNLLYLHNALDMELYRYAKTLFVDQSNFFTS